MLACPEGRGAPPVARNQALIMQALRANQKALLLFNEPDGMRERKRLIEHDRQRAHAETRAPKLQYHLYLVSTHLSNRVLQL